MKKFLYILATVILLPIEICMVVLYAILYPTELFCRMILIYLEKGMEWISENII